MALSSEAFNSTNSINSLAPESQAEGILKTQALSMIKSRKQETEPIALKEEMSGP
jgi:hypothetical protein